MHSTVLATRCTKNVTFTFSGHGLVAFAYKDVAVGSWQRELQVCFFCSARDTRGRSRTLQSTQKQLISRHRDYEKDLLR